MVRITENYRNLCVGWARLCASRGNDFPIPRFSFLLFSQSRISQRNNRPGLEKNEKKRKGKAVSRLNQ